MKQCKGCKYWKFHFYADYYVYKPNWFFYECDLWLHNRKPICVESEFFEPKWYKTKTFGCILAGVVLGLWIGISIWLAYK